MKYILLLMLFPMTLFATIKIAFVGDSITVGMLTKKSFLDLLSERYKNEEKDILILNRSFGGALVDCTYTLTLAILTIDRPDYIVYLLGTNDSIFNTNKDKLKKNFDKAFSLIGWNCKRYILGMIEETPVNPNYIHVLFPIYQYLHEKYHPYLYPKLILTSDVLKTATDKIHPSDKGHVMIAEIIYQALHEVKAY